MFGLGRGQREESFVIGEVVGEGLLGREDLADSWCHFTVAHCVDELAIGIQEVVDPRNLREILASSRIVSMSNRHRDRNISVVFSVQLCEFPYNLGILFGGRLLRIDGPSSKCTASAFS